jgi:hypothetical protein
MTAGKNSTETRAAAAALFRPKKGKLKFTTLEKEKWSLARCPTYPNQKWPDGQGHDNLAAFWEQ